MVNPNGASMTSNGPSLPVIALEISSDARARRSSGWAAFIHALRMIVLTFAVIGLHRTFRNRIENNRQPIENDSLLAFAQSVWPAANLCLPNSANKLLTDVVDPQRNLIGQLAQTAPLADSIVGYAGPSNLIIAISNEGVIQRLTIAHSADTAEHVQIVRNNVDFWKQFEGRPWLSDASPPESATANQRPDGVSGATLTSLAIAESILLRIDAANSQNTSLASDNLENFNSLKFAQPLDNEEVRRLVTETAQRFPNLWNPEQVDVNIVSPWEAIIVGSSDKILGRVIRSGPLADQILGYQGPSEVLICLDERQHILAAELRGSFDNEPYRRYTRDESSFWSKFEGRSVASLATIDLSAEGIEGVSGATMTSLAVAETIQACCKKLVEQARQNDVAAQAIAEKSSPVRHRRWNFSETELFTIMITFCAAVWSFSRLRGQPTIRVLWQLVCFVGLGWVSGNLLSLALFSGWIQGGVPWQLAPGLTMLLIIAVGCNIFLRRNVYCDHLCPHGIAQQWLLKSSRPKITSSKKFVLLEQAMKVSSIAAIIFVGLSLITGRSMPVAWLEPFDTYAWRIGLSWSVMTWGASLVISYLRPMAYCRHACPTGKILGYTRFSPKRSQITVVDVAVVLVGLYCLVEN